MDIITPAPLPLGYYVNVSGYGTVSGLRLGDSIRKDYSELARVWDKNESFD